MSEKYIRKSSPELTLKLWQIFDPKECYSSDRQLMESMISQLSEIHPKHKIDEQFCRQSIRNALEDKLLVEDIESEDQLLRIKPSFNRISFGDLTNDWFCFECHSCDPNKPLIDCKTCFRAIHQKCIKIKVNSNDFRCDYCLNCEQIDKSLKINRLNRKSMNQFFGLVLKCLEKSIDNFDIYSEYELEVNHMSNVLIFNYLDLNTIKSKVISEKYKNNCEFENDFKHFVHNFRVYRMEGLDDYFEDTFEHHISYLKSCSDCYNYAFNDEFHNSEDPDEWFSRLCDPPHPLVYAKCGSYPFWPSKVIQIISKDEYCVQFFESPKYERSNVRIVSTKPIDFPFEHIKFRDNGIRGSLRLLTPHLKRLIDEGFDGNSHYQKTLQFIDKYKLLETFIPKKKKKVLKQTKPKGRQSKRLKSCLKKKSIYGELSKQKTINFKIKLQPKTKSKITPKTGLKTDTKSNPKTNSKTKANKKVIPSESESVNESAGTSGQNYANESIESTDYLDSENESPFSKFLKSNEISEEIKFQICGLFIKKHINSDNVS